MRYCKKCLQPDTRPNIVFDEEQVCYACRYEESKASIDWEKRETELRMFAEEAKAKARSQGIPYDCVIGVSGGKDSTFQSLYVRDKLKLRPLLVNSAPSEITEIGRKNIENLANQGFDILTIKTDPVVAKSLARKSFFDRGNIFVASEFSLWASAYIVADKFNIPLIIQGENAALTLGVALHSNVNGNAFGVVDLNTLKGNDDFLFTSLPPDKRYFYQIPDFVNMQRKGIKAVWLQYYAKEWSQVLNAEFAVAHGLTGRDDDLHDIGRYRRYSALDNDAVIVNQMIKYLKFGFGFATDEACYDIREGRLTRDEAIKLVKEYDGKYSQKYMDIFCKSIDITESEFWQVVDKYVNTKLFYKDESGVWQPKFEVGVDFAES